MAGTVPMVSQSRSKRRRSIWLLSGGGVALCIVLLVLWGRSWVADYARDEIIARARANGIILQPKTIEVSSSSVRLGNATLAFEGVHGVSATISSAEIQLRQLKAARIVVEGLDVQAVGEPLALMGGLRDWQAKYSMAHESEAAPAAELHKTRLRWSPAAQSAPFLVIDDFHCARNPVAGNGSTTWAVTGSRAQVGAYVLQPLALALQLEPAAVEIGFGATQMADAAVRGGWRRAEASDDFHVTFGALPIGPLLGQLNVPLHDPRLAAGSCAGGVSLRVPQDSRLAYTGQLSLDLVGWTPPPPPELEGFTFGNTTTLRSMLEMDRGLSQVKLHELELTSGALKLTGRGFVQVVALAYAQIKAELRGRLPCSAFASAMAESRLGKAYGRWVAKNAHKTIDGSVDIGVRVEADTRQLQQAEFVKQVGVGCGLRPMTLKEALSLGLPPAPDADLLRHAAQNLPKLDLKLPEIPKLPPLPTINIPSANKEQ